MSIQNRGDYVKKTLTDFGRNVKIRLIELGQSQNWLIEQVQNQTGLYFDRSYLYKIQTGQLSTPGILDAICNILDLPSQDHSIKADVR